MSWNFHKTGRPAAIARALDDYSSLLTGRSKKEFDGAKEAIKTLVARNRNDRNSEHLPYLVQVHCYGCGDDGGEMCQVKIEPICGDLTEPAPAAVSEREPAATGG